LVLEFREQTVGSPHGVRVASHALRAALFSFGDQLRSFEHGHVLLHGGERHLVTRGQLTDGRIGGHDPGQDVSPRGIGQRTEQLVQSPCCLLTCNHVVVYTSTPFSTDECGSIPSVSNRQPNREAIHDSTAERR
jgi:hypothetical protein